MKRQTSPPVILPFPTPAALPGNATDARAQLERAGRLRFVPAEDHDDALPRMRARLLRMIIENERMRNDGPRAS